MSVSDGGEGPDAAAPRPDSDLEGFVAIRSFVVRAILERDDDEPAWHGSITEVFTGARRQWRRTGEIGRFIDQRLAATAVSAAVSVDEGIAMAAPPLTDVVSGMLALLAARLPTPTPGVPEPNVTLERVDERLVGIGNRLGSERTTSLGVHALKGGRLEAVVRFQLWAGSADDIDDAVLALHTNILQDREQLRADGFLKLDASRTTVAEHLEAAGAWRKTASYDLLYEYRYRDTEEADSLIARIPVTTSIDTPGSVPVTVTVTDEMVRWDDETSPALVLRGPLALRRISALAFMPGAAPGGAVTVRRTRDGAAGPPVSFPDLASLLQAVGGDDPAEDHAEVALTPSELLTGIGAVTGETELGDWDTDGTPDSYSQFDRTVDPAVRLTDPRDRFEITYSTTGGLDQQAVVYLRINAR
ncbi:MAG TPA: hypothetical protein VHF25_12190 [Nitriliruptorales bacterium]|nr:hypothetical protein [Nitriliruptorales bacterium]